MPYFFAVWQFNPPILLRALPGDDVSAGRPGQIDMLERRKLKVW